MNRRRSLYLPRSSFSLFPTFSLLFSPPFSGGGGEGSMGLVSCIWPSTTLKSNVLYCYTNSHLPYALINLTSCKLGDVLKVYYNINLHIFCILMNNTKL